MIASRKSLWLAGICASTLGASGAWAQAPTSPQADAGQSRAEVEEIIVTARRREESAQTVPVSVTALTAAALEERQVLILGDLTATVPGIRFVPQGGAGNMNVVLRGLSGIPVGDGPNAVITYFADVPLPFEGSNIPAFDLGNIQVLKGPQGTLFGRSSIAGAVVLTPQEPTYDYEGYLSAKFGNYNYGDVEGVLNVPIIADKVALRLGTKFSRRDGYTVNVDPSGGRDRESLQQESFRASLLIEPTANIRNLTVVDYLKARETGIGSVLFAVLPSGLVRTPALSRFWDCHTFNATFNPVPCTGFRPDADIDDAFAQQQADGPRRVHTGGVTSPVTDRDVWGVSNKTDIEFGGATFRNILGYRRTRGITNSETDGVGFIPSIIDGNVRVRKQQLSDEVQLFGTAFDDKLDWIVGAFYLKDKPFGPQGSRLAIAAPYGSGRYTETYNHKRNTAIFGQIGYDLSSLVEGLRFNGGMRQSWDKHRMCAVASSPGSLEPNGESRCATDPAGSFIDYKGNKLTYTVGLDWQVNQNLFLYATHRRGYREGGINGPRFDTPATAILIPFQTYEPEILEDIEIGMKTDWSFQDVVGRFNIAAYSGKHKNVVNQLNVAALIPSTDRAFPLRSSLGVNAGQRTVRGVEAELTIKPVPWLTLSNNVAYTHYRVDSVGTNPFTRANLPTPASPSPKWATTTSLQVDFPGEVVGGDLSLHADYYWQSSYVVSDARLPAYDVANARIQLSGIGGPDAGIGGSGVDVALFVRNIFDQDNVNSSVATVNSLGIHTVSYAEPRMYGLEVTVSFGR